MPSTLPPSIFNDVVGPVMRGPSSSHSAAALRIGRLARDLAGGTPERVRFDFDTGGSLPTTHVSQGSDIGMFGGLLGWEADDERLPESARWLAEAGCAVTFHYARLGDPHPNTYRLTIERGGLVHRLVAVSTGGGMIEVVEIDGFAVTLYGDVDVALVEVSADRDAADAVAALAAGRATVHGDGPWLVVLRSDAPADALALASRPGVTRVRALHAVLPVRTPAELAVPFLHAGEMVTRCGDPRGYRLSDRAIEYECARGSIDADGVFARMRAIRAIVRRGVDGGLAGTAYGDRILGAQSPGFVAAEQRGGLVDLGVLNRAIAYVAALMETKSSMGVIVAAPTAGSCATFPGTCLATAEALGVDEETELRAMLSAGLIGVFVATRSSFAAEVGGCQAETGAGAAMAAAAVVELMGGHAGQVLSAASHALQNVLGLICDPIANRVEAPCLGRNVTGAANALTAANIALAGFDHLIPLDEVLDTHRAVSERMARELRCTALGGLSITPTSRAIEARLAGA